MFIVYLIGHHKSALSKYFFSNRISELQYSYNLIYNSIT